MIKQGSKVLIKDNSEFGLLEVVSEVYSDEGIDYCKVIPQEFKSIVREVKTSDLIELSDKNIKLDLTQTQLIYLYKVVEELKVLYTLNYNKNTLYLDLLNKIKLYLKDIDQEQLDSITARFGLAEFE